MKMVQKICYIDVDNILTIEYCELKYCVNEMIIKPPLATARTALCIGAVHLFVCLSVCRQNTTRGQSNLTKSASRGANSPVRGHPTGSKFVPLNSWFLLVFHSNYRPRMHRLATVHARDNQRPTTSRHSLSQ